MAKKAKISADAGPSALLPLIALGGCCLFALARHWSVPPVTPASSPPSLFSAARAGQAIAEVEACGVKSVGSYANEVCAVEALRRQIALAGAGAEGRLEVDVQSASGHYYIDFLGGLTNIYRNITNVLVKLKGASSSERHCAVLVSAHFDSAINSPASSDDTGQIGIMVELLRVLAHGDKLSLDIIFNFNGGEETLMQAAHGFISSHPWSKNLCAMINLEAVGSGGRELLFQAGPNHRWLVETYAEAVRRPHGSSVSQVLFQTGVIPGETDYRIYRDFGGLPGVDFAVTKNGWVYHTSRDSLAHMDLRSIQRYGENVFDFLKGIVTKLEQGKPVGQEANEASVYFDVAGFFFVTYPAPVAQKLHIAVSLLILSWELWRSSLGAFKLTRMAAVIFVGVVTAAGSAVLVAAAISFTPLALVCSGHPELVPAIYGSPAALGFICVLQKLGGSELIEKDIAAASTSLAACLTILLSLSLVSVPGAYPFFIWAVMHSVSDALAPALPARLSGPVSILGRVVPWLLLAQLTVLYLELLCPLSMRSGTNLPGDIVVAAASGLLLGFNLAMSARFLPRLPRSTVAWLMSVAVLGLCVAAFSFPYSYDRPKRLYAQHVSRSAASWDFTLSQNTKATLKPLDSGIWIHAFDWNGMGTIRDHTSHGLPKGAISQSDWNGVYGQLPFWFPVRLFIGDGVWQSRPRPELSSDLRLEASTTPRVGGRRLQLSFRGSPQMALAIGPRSQVTAWSPGFHPDRFIGSSKLPVGNALPEALPPPRPDCDCFWVLFAEGGAEPTRGQAEAFNLTLDVRSGQLNVEVWAMHYESTTPDLLEVRKEMPNWVDMATWVSELQVHTMTI